MTTQDRQLQVTSQNKLVNNIMAACSNATALTTLEVIGALELAKGDLVMRMSMAQAQAAQKASNLITPASNPN